LRAYSRMNCDVPIIPYQSEWRRSWFALRFPSDESIHGESRGDRTSEGAVVQVCSGFIPCVAGSIRRCFSRVTQVLTKNRPFSGVAIDVVPASIYPRAPGMSSVHRLCVCANSRASPAPRMDDARLSDKTIACSFGHAALARSLRSSSVHRTVEAIPAHTSQSLVSSGTVLNAGCRNGR